MISLRLILVIFVAALGPFQFGYNSGVINAPGNVIKSTFLNSTSDIQIPDADIVLAWSFVVAVFSVGGMAGSLIVGVAAEAMGRRLFMFSLSILGVISGLILAFSELANSYLMLTFGRIMVGVTCGAYTGLVPMYLSEVSPLEFRGAIGIINQFAIVTGIFISQLLGLEYILGNETYWPILLGLTAVPAAIQCLTILFICPESPRYLLITKKSEHLARKSLETLKITKDPQILIDEMRAEADQLSLESSISVFGLLTSRRYRWPLVIAVIMQLSQQLSGINGIFYYSSDLFQTSANLSKLAADLATLSVGVILLVMTAISIPLIDRVGRKVLHSIGLGGMFVASVFVVIFLSIDADWTGYVGVAFCLLFVVFFASGPGSIPWLITAELFSQSTRPSAIAIATFVNWLSNFVVGLAFEPIQKAIEQYVFVIFGVLLLGFFAFTVLFVPETKGKTFQQISAELVKSEAQPVRSNNQRKSYNTEDCTTA